MAGSLSELFRFIRLKLCIFAIFLSIVGYFFFNPISSNIVFVVLSSFFLCAGMGAYNNLTDVVEDYINKKRVDKFALNSEGKVVVLFCTSLGFVFSLFLSPTCLIFSSSIIVTGVIYSFFRLKKYFLVKNFYSGFGSPQLFLLGAGTLNVAVLPYYFIFSIFFFVGSFISDMRDYDGDKATGVKTVPIRLGYDFTKEIIYLMLAGASVLVLLTNFYMLSPALLFVLMIFFLVSKNKIEVAHSSVGVLFAFLAVWLMVNINLITL